MYRATTPTHIFTLQFPTSDCDEIQVSYQQDGLKLVKHYQDGVLPSGMSLDGNDVCIYLTQDETKRFKKGRAKAQIRVLSNGNVMASEEMIVHVYDVISEDNLS